MTEAAGGHGWVSAVGAAAIFLGCRHPPDVVEEGLRTGVVAVWDGDQQLCLGAAVGPHAVLTAQHCVVAAIADGRVGELDVVLHGGRRVGVRSAVVARPGAESLEALEGGDLAVLTVVDALEGGLELEGRSVGVGAMVYLVRAETGEVEGAPVLHVEPSQVFVRGATCGGDSGGPLVGSDGRVVAVASWRTPQPCGEGTSVFTDVVRHRTWINETIERAR